MMDGRNLNRFEQCYKLDDEVLGNGNFSTVLSGISIQQSLSKRNGSRSDDSITNPTSYAIKCIPKEELDQDDILAIFNEVSILQHLYHPHIISLHDFFEENQFFYLVMEKVTGGELFDRIVVKEFYNENEARNVCKIMLDALEYMHGQNIAHRDLKPENLLLVHRGNDSLVKIADFGFAKRCDDSCNDGLGNLQTQCGTPTYVSPEIIQRASYGTKCDMWCVGIILYILLGGYPPFIENDQRELFRKICNGEYEFHDEYFHRVSDDAKNLISSLIEINPKKRFSAKRALEDEWIRCDDDELVKKDLSGANFSKLKQFNAKKKVRAAVLSLTAVNRFNSLLCGDLKIAL